MKKISVVAGKVGVGKSRALFKKANELGKENKAILFLGLEHDKTEVAKMMDENVIFGVFENTEDLLISMVKQNIRPRDAVLVVDNLNTMLTSKEAVTKLIDLNFSKSLFSLQLNRGATVDKTVESEATKDISKLLKAEKESIELEFI